MRRRDGLIPLVTLKEGDRPLYQQLYEQLRTAILDGRLAGGMRLPSTRALADDLGVSRTTVIQAYQNLEDEGYVEVVAGSGTYVAESPPERALRARRPQPSGARPVPEPVERHDELLSERGKRMYLLGSEIHWESDVTPFAPWLPALDAFPTRAWQSVENSLAPVAPELLPADPAGEPALRRAIAAHVAATRGGVCHPDQVVIMSVLQEGYGMLAELLLDPDETLVFEDPGYLRGRRAFEDVAHVVPAPVDQDGILVPRELLDDPSTRAIYVTPSNQVPLGTTLSMERRRALVAWAQERGTWIIEDDYDGEFRFEGRPLPSLWSLDTSRERVIYCKTFRKVLFPSLNLAFMVLPPSLVEPFVAARQLRRGPPPSVREQRTLAAFIEQGHFARHIRQTRMVYAERRDALREVLRAGINHGTELSDSEAGSHLVLRLPHGVDDRVIAARAAERGLQTPALSDFSLGPLERGGLVLGFGAFTPPALRRAAGQLVEVLNEEL